MTTSPIGIKQGFTFIELILVMVALGVLFVAVVPRFGGGWSSFQMERAAFAIAQTLRSARVLAITEGRPVDWVWDAHLRRACVVLPEAENCAAASWPGRLGQPRAVSELVQVSVLRDDQMSQEPIERISFWPNGTSQPATLLIGDGTDPRYEIRVEASTGDVALQPAGAATDGFAS